MGSRPAYTTWARRLAKLLDLPPPTPVPVGTGGKLELRAQDWAALEQMAMVGCTAAEMADYLGIGKATLYRGDTKVRFVQISARKWAASKYLVRRAQFEGALGRGMAATISRIWLGKQWLLQRDKRDLAGDQGTPLLASAAQAIDHLGETLIHKKENQHS